MEKFKNYLLAASGFVILVLAMAMTNVGHSVAQTVGDCIRICNPESAPIPVRAQGTTNVAGEVTVRSSATTPVVTKLLGLPPSDAFQRQVMLEVPHGSNSTSTVIGVPAGKFLTINFVSGQFNSNSNAIVLIDTVANLNGGEFGFGPTQLSNALGTPGFSTPVLIYADPGSLVQITLLQANHGGGAKVNLTLTGFFTEL